VREVDADSDADDDDGGGGGGEFFSADECEAAGAASSWSRLFV